MADDTSVPDLAGETTEAMDAHERPGQSIMATCELRQLLQAEVEDATETHPCHDTTIIEVPTQFFGETAGNGADANTPPGFIPTVELKQILQIEDETEDSSGFDPYNRV